MSKQKLPAEELYWRLQSYTLSLRDPTFMHQHVVDAWTAQNARQEIKPITLAFALVGLYLHVERGFSGRQVQRVHTLLAENTVDWPSFPLPAERGAVTAREVLSAPEGVKRRLAIDAWCTSVWEAYGESHDTVAELLARHGMS
ncbi:MAG TPA: DUF5946 family protein [Thermoanaerobaculia bacterium]|nr:DUF5946 family protein [Thermoanaerobaculia bacterium]